jgi:hypothetical protein
MGQASFFRALVARPGQKWATHLPAKARPLGAHLVLALGPRAAYQRAASRENPMTRHGSSAASEPIWWQNLSD